MASSSLRKAKTENGLRRTWGFQPETLNEEERTVWVVAATETPVRRYFGNEILLCTRKAVVATRLKNLPVLDSHRSTSVKDILGQVIETRFEDRKLHMKLLFADNDNGNAALALVRDGMLHSASVGYGILEAEESTGRNGVPVITVTRWEPTEISLVSVPADPNATIRGNVKMARKPTTTRRDPADDILEDEIETGHDEDTVITPVRRRIGLSIADTQRLFGMRDTAVRSGVKVEEFDEIVSKCGSMNSIREAYLDLMYNRDKETPTDSHVGLDPFTGNSRSGDDPNNLIVDALAVRLGAKAEIKNNPLVGRSTIEIGRRYLEQRGVSTRGMDDKSVGDVLIGDNRRLAGLSSRGQHTTSDFPLLLESAGNRTLLQRYEVYASPLKGLSNKRNVRDFRPHTVIRPGEAPELEKLLQSGSIKYGTIGEESQTLTVDTYAKMFSISRNALVNDDLGAFDDFLSEFGRSAASVEGNLFANLLLANNRAGVLLSDNKPLFHADRNNIGAAGQALNVETLGEARKHMRLHKNVNGTGTAGVVPAVLLVGPELETEAERTLTQIAATKVGDANPFAGKLRLEVENRLEGTGWYLFADPAQRPAFMHGYLQDREGPQINANDGWNILGVEYRCFLDFGCGPLDWRAAYYVPGQ